METAKSPENLIVYLTASCGAMTEPTNTSYGPRLRAYIGQNVKTALKAVMRYTGSGEKAAQPATLGNHDIQVPITE